MNVSNARGRVLGLAVSALLVGASSAAAAPPKVGGLVPLTGAGSCIAASPTSPCTTDTRIAGASHVAISSNGSAIYVSGAGPSPTQGIVLAYARDPQSGRIGSLLGCFSRTGDGPCTAESSVYKASYLASGPNGLGLYVTASDGGNNNSLIPIGTDPSTGGFTGIIGACFYGPLGACDTATSQLGNGIGGIRGVAMSSNGSLYTVGHDGPPGSKAKGGIAAFARDPATGALTSETNCLGSASSAAFGDPGCTNAATGDALLADAQDLASGPNQLYAVVDNNNSTTLGAVLSYSRDPISGKLLARTECFAAVSSIQCNHAASLGGASTTPVAAAVAPDGTAVYAISDPPTGGVITTLALKHDGTLLSDLGCVSFPALSGCGTSSSASLNQPLGIAVSPDSSDIYVASNAGLTHGYVTAYARSTVTLLPGTSPIDCVSDAGAPGGCLSTPALAGAEGIAISPDGRFVYVASNGGGLVALARELPPSCSAAASSTSTGTAVAIPLSCVDPNGEPLTGAVTSGPGHGTVSGTGPFIYTPNPGFTGTDTFTFTASDGTNGSGQATATVTVTPKSGPPPPPPPSAGPTSRIDRLRSRIKASKLHAITGTAAAGAGLRSVNVGILEVSGGARTARTHRACFYLTSAGKLTRVRASKRGTCAATHLLRANGTARWTLRLRRRLARGTYIVYSQAVSRTGAKERIRLRGGANVARITVT